MTSRHPDSNDRPFTSDPEVEALVAGFLATTLPKPVWTHRAHPTTGLWMVIRHGLDPARSLMPAAIKRFNEAVGGVNTATSGYHETITQNWVTGNSRSGTTARPCSGRPSRGAGGSCPPGPTSRSFLLRGRLHGRLGVEPLGAADHDHFTGRDAFQNLDLPRLPYAELNRTTDRLVTSMTQITLPVGS